MNRWIVDYDLVEPEGGYFDCRKYDIKANTITGALEQFEETIAAPKKAQGCAVRVYSICEAWEGDGEE